MPSRSNYSKISLPILSISFLLGLFLSWGLFSGDEQGRVNILQLIAIYVFLPIFSLLFSTVSILAGKNWNFAKLISLVPLWSNRQKSEFFRLAQKNHSKLYFFYQSQLAALSFSIASLLVLLIMLLSTDVNFVWRSTLLDAEKLLPLLKYLSMPWWFWQDAQPSLELLSVTQDSRLISQNNTGTSFGEWWQFIIAAQLLYAFLLRFVSLVVCSLLLRWTTNPKKTIQIISRSNREASSVLDTDLAMPVSNIDSDYALNNWGGLEQNLLDAVEKKLRFTQQSELKAGPLATYTEQMVSERWQEPQLLIVKGWEPPLAELSDFMQNGKGYLLPLDWNKQGFKVLKDIHLNEWRRFVFHQPNWQLVQLEMS